MSIRIKNLIIPCDVPWWKRLLIKWRVMDNPYDFYLGEVEKDGSAYFILEAHDFFDDKNTRTGWNT